MEKLPIPTMGVSATENIKAFFDYNITKLGLIHEHIRNFLITDISSSKEVLTSFFHLREIENFLESGRKEVIKPYSDEIKEINSKFKLLEETVEETQNLVQEKLTKFYEEEQQNPFGERFDSLEVSEGKMTIKKYWDYEIMDSEEIPRAFLSVNDEAIEMSIKNGIRNIPGIRVFENEKITYRMK